MDLRAISSILAMWALAACAAPPPQATTPGAPVSALDGTYTGPGKVPPAYDCGPQVPPIFHAEMTISGNQFSLKPWPTATPVTGELLPDGTLRNKRGKLGTLTDGRAVGFVSYGARCRTTFELTK